MLRPSVPASCFKMAATILSHSVVEPPKGLATLQFYEYRRLLAASTPDFINHTPRDVAPAFEEVQDFADHVTRTIDPPYHLDLNLGLAGSNNYYWSEDDRKEKRAQRAGFAASTHSRSAPTSPIVERSAFLEPRGPQYTPEPLIGEMGDFLRKTAPASGFPKSDAEDDAHKRQNSVKNVRRVVRKTARRVLEVGNEQLPSQCQLPHLQRSRALSKGQSEQAVEKLTSGGRSLMLSSTSRSKLMCFRIEILPDRSCRGLYRCRPK